MERQTSKKIIVDRSRKNEEVLQDRIIGKGSQTVLSTKRGKKRRKGKERKLPMEFKHVVESPSLE